MNVSLLRILNTKVWDFRPDMAQNYAAALKNAIELSLPNDVEKQAGYFLSRKGYQKDGVTHAADFEDKLFVGNIYRVENHLRWGDEQLQDDDEIIDVVVVDGPVTRDGDGCSYGTKDFRDQVMYANTIPQVIGHIFVINTPGGQSSCRNDYEMMIRDCREKGKPTVAFVDGMCCSSGVNLASRCDRTIVMNPKDEFGCIGSMAAFWSVAHDTVDSDGYRYVELVGKDCPEKNAWWREAAKGEYEKLQAELDKDTEEFHQSVRENRPLVTDDMLTGKVYEAQELIPALVDEIGDMERAIECIFELADETLTAARLVTAEPKNEPAGKPADEPEELSKLNEQQKAAMAKDAKNGSLVMADDGHVTEERQGIFGPVTVEVAKPQNNENMTEEEKKAQEAEAAQAAQEEKPADEQEQKPAEEEQKPAEEEQKPADEEEQKPAEEEQKPADEEEQKPAEAEEKPADEEEQKPAEEQEQKPAEEEEKPADEEEQKPAEEQEQKPAEEEQKPADDQPSDENIENAEAEIDKIQETLHNAEQMIAERDNVIAGRDETIRAMQHDMEEQQQKLDETQKKLDGANALIGEKDALIESLKKQVSDLQAEVKELSEEPTPMTDKKAGVPADNGTGAPPKGKKSCSIRRGMSYEEIMKASQEE